MNPASTVAIACLSGLILCLPAIGADPESAPFDGEWSLEFRVNTRPGGETFTTTQGGSVSPYHLNYQATIESFRFQSDRSVRLDERERPALNIQSTARFGDVTSWDRQNHQGRLHLQGAGTGQGQDRILKLTIRWGGHQGTGVMSDSFGTSSAYRWAMSEEGTHITMSNEGGTRTLPFGLWKSVWEIRPQAIERREISADVIQETVTYRGRQPNRLAPLDPGGFSPPLPVTEEIEFKQVRQLKFVPRG
jgi:hypothetical protein